MCARNVIPTPKTQMRYETNTNENESLNWKKLQVAKSNTMNCKSEMKIIRNINNECEIAT